MRLVTAAWTGQKQEQEHTAFMTERGLVPLAWLNEKKGMNWETDILTLLQSGRMDALREWYYGKGAEILDSLPILPDDEVRYGALYRRPGKIIGIGMNYLEKAIELSGRPPGEEPVIFLKPDTSLIGPEDSIILPDGAGQIAAEAELAIVIGRTCRRVAEEEAIGAVAGYTTSLDMTAKDIHARNSRFLQRAKSFDTFLSLGASLSTPDEYANLSELAVETVLNGEVMHRNTVSQMIFSPTFLISFLSHIMTLNPGDVILTGTPGSVYIKPGDQVECRIEGMKTLTNLVSL
ncbi:fumarylacetoacetate hydrolase family protein [Saccharibacillus kuerlensis]|uniref:Fumarylacetoacetase-like C-terminal domain-containing protein n=1 Tax=Saccharibacillus kuerlensis TaxID=459527 RepID=A0ABQ2L568_9BACL|nr:fumarylacetoacetate hydrolase family protein [Saccharibacillus kuerlensis]GGO03622.1 hypothetical protein GCM10010969_27960 [Saccharibacillus kuerlensis]